MEKRNDEKVKKISGLGLPFFAFPFLPLLTFLTALLLMNAACRQSLPNITAEQTKNQKTVEFHLDHAAFSVPPTLQDITLYSFGKPDKSQLVEVNGSEREVSLDKLAAEKKARMENFAEAAQAVKQIKDDKERIVKLVNLAILQQQKKTDESQKNAEDLMNEASRLVNQNPETQTDFERLLPVIDGYATVNPKKAMAMIAPVIEKSNELINAYIILMNYYDKNYPSVSENEFVFGAQDSYSSFRGSYIEIAKKLGSEDFEQTKNLTDSFRRSDVRIMAKLILAESLLAK